MQRSLRASLILSLIGMLFLPFASVEAARVTYTREFQLNVSGSGIKLKILAGSQADLVIKDATFVTIQLSAGQQFRLRYPGPNPGQLVNDAGLPACNVMSDGDNELALIGPATVVVTPVDTACSGSGEVGGIDQAGETAAEVPEDDAGASAGISNGSTAPGAARVRLFSPNGGEVLDPGDEVLVLWSARAPEGFAGYRLSLSTDDGETFTEIGEKRVNDGHFLWTVPDKGALFAIMHVEMLDQDGNVLAEDKSRDRFIISGSTAVVGGEVVEEFGAAYGASRAKKEAGAAAPVTDPTAAGSFDAETATEATPTVDVDLRLDTASDEELLCIPGTAFKGARDTVYYCARDGRRYVFPNRKTYQSWFADFSHVIKFSDAHVGRIPIGGNVTYKPGARLVKVQTDPKVYAVTRGGTLRHVKDEAVAERVFGKDWAQQIDDVLDVLFADYTIGETIE